MSTSLDTCGIYANANLTLVEGGTHAVDGEGDHEVVVDEELLHGVHPVSVQEVGVQVILPADILQILNFQLK